MSNFTGPLAGKTVAITRPEHQCGEMIEIVETMGGTAYVAAMIEITAPKGGELNEFIEKTASCSYDQLVFLSVNSIRYLFEEAQRTEMLEQLLEGINGSGVLVIGTRTQKELVDHCVKNGVVARIQSNRNEAIPHFRAVIEADPPEPDLTIVARAYYNLGSTLGRQGKIDEAIEAYQESLRVDPRYYNAYRGLGWAFQKQGRVDESIEAYQQFLRVFPDHAAARRDLDDVLAHKARLAKK